MSLLFNKEPPVFDERGFDDDGWTREDHANLAKYGVKNPTPELIERARQEREMDRLKKDNEALPDSLKETIGRWF